MLKKGIFGDVKLELWVLNEFQLLYITKGKGMFSSRTAGKREVNEDLVLRIMITFSPFFVEPQVSLL